MKSLSKIAKEMGVSPACVSYVYNNKWKEQRISESLAKKILRKLEEENCRPNFLGTQLKTGKTRTIGIVLADMAQPYNIEILSGIVREVAENDYFALLSDSNLGDSEAERLESLFGRGIEGILLVPQCISGNSKKIIEEIGRHIPIVFIDNCMPDLNFDFFVSDNRWGAYKATQHCLENGCPRIAYIGGMPGLFASDERFLGYKSAIKEAGLSLPERLIFRVIKRGEGCGKAVRAILDIEMPDAIFVECFTDFKDGFKILFDKGIRIPGDLRLIGFDAPNMAMQDCEDVKNFASLPIPYVEQMAEEMGIRATKRLFALIKRKERKIIRGFIKPKLRF